MTEYLRERSNRMQAILFAFAIVMANNMDVAFEDTLKKPLSFQEQEKTVKKAVSKATLNKNRWTLSIFNVWREKKDSKKISTGGAVKTSLGLIKKTNVLNKSNGRNILWLLYKFELDIFCSVAIST